MPLLFKKKRVGFRKKKVVPKKLKKAIKKVIEKTQDKVGPLSQGGDLVKGIRAFTDSSPFPNVTYKKMIYEDSFQIRAGGSSTGLTGTEQNFSLNGLYDPDVTNSGHQPYGFDQICTTVGPYTRYKVIRTKVNLTFHNPDVGTMVVFVMATDPSNYNQSISGSSFNSLAEKPFIRHKRIPAAGAGSKDVTMHFDFPMHTLYALTKQGLKDDLNNSTGSASANPGWATYLHCCVLDLAAPASGTYVWLDVKITYSVMFYDRYALGQS